MPTHCTRHLADIFIPNNENDQSSSLPQALDMPRIVRMLQVTKKLTGWTVRAFTAQHASCNTPRLTLQEAVIPVSCITKCFHAPNWIADLAGRSFFSEVRSFAFASRVTYASFCITLVDASKMWTPGRSVFACSMDLNCINDSGLLSHTLT